MPEIILEKVNKRFDKFVAVDNLDLYIADRGFVTLLGPSGCGKTTTLRMIAGLETPTTGRILIDGKPVFDSSKGINIPPNKRDIGFLFQNYALWPHMTVYENIAFPMRVVGTPSRKIRLKVEKLMQLLHLPAEYEKRYPDTLSGGEQQRVALARALANNPKYIIADEPTGNIDPKMSMEMMNQLIYIQQTLKKTVIVVTHELYLVKYFRQRVIKLDHGKIVSDTPGGATE